MSKIENDEFIPVNFKILEENSITRTILVKPHIGKDSIKPSKRTLYLINIPQYLNLKCLKFMYKIFGEIENVYVHSKPKGCENVIEEPTCKYYENEPGIGYKVAYIVFKHEASLKKALESRELQSVPIKMLSPNKGLKKWAREYNSSFMDAKNAQKDIELYMQNYDKILQDEKEKIKEVDGVEDEEGWTTITKHSKKAKISRNETVSKRILEKEAKDSAKKSLLTFYRCQLRDSKMEHILQLRKKFEKDKERILQLKASRKFKPF